jgi:hypothetical protein
MIGMDMIKPFIHNIFQQNGGKMLSKASILSLVSKSNIAGALPMFQKIPDRQDYTENSLTGEVQNAAQQQQGGGVAGKIRSKIGV